MDTQATDRQPIFLKREHVSELLLIAGDRGTSPHDELDAVISAGIELIKRGEL